MILNNGLVVIMQQVLNKGNKMNYGMFTPEGDEAVALIVEVAKKNNLGWQEIMPLLRNLADSDYDRFGEAMDTQVREAVYNALNLTSDFYV